jgi:hypothetical protein
MTRRHSGALVAVIVVLAACGTATDTTSDVASLDKAEGQDASVLGAIVDQEGQLFEFSACMRDEGIEVGDPTVDEEGNVILGTPLDMVSDHGALMAAYEVCNDLIGGRAMGHGEGDRTAVHDRLVEFAKCVRENGYYEIPDPDFSGANGDIFPGLDMDDPDYQAAEDICKGVLVDDDGSG